MKINIDIDEITLRELVVSHIRSVLGGVDFISSDVKIEVKSKQNYRSEWEEAAFRARIDKRI